MKKIKISALALAILFAAASAFTTNRVDDGHTYYRDASGTFILKDQLPGECELGSFNCEYKFNGISNPAPISQTQGDYTAVGTEQRVFVPE
jgi:hypothetical protein